MGEYAYFYWDKKYMRLRAAGLYGDAGTKGREGRRGSLWEKRTCEPERPTDRPPTPVFCSHAAEMFRNMPICSAVRRARA